MGGIIGKGTNKAYRKGKSGKVKCPECKQNVPMLKLPEHLPFAQAKLQKEGSMQQQTQQQMGQSQAQNITINIPSQGKTPNAEMKYCSHCGKQIKKSATFCEICGGQQ